MSAFLTGACIYITLSGAVGGSPVPVKPNLIRGL